MSERKREDELVARWDDYGRGVTRRLSWRLNAMGTSDGEEEMRCKNSEEQILMSVWRRDSAIRR
jgi:hypothetical protein